MRFDTCQAGEEPDDAGIVKRIAFIGTGGRSLSYAKAYQPAEDVEVAAIADPLEGNRKAFRLRSGIPECPEFSDWRRMLDEITDLHGVVVATPNHLHTEQALAVLERGLPLALEKPLATTPADCEAIFHAATQPGRRSLLGFVLRSTPFYSKIKELIDDGAIGRLVAVDADELVGYAVSSIVSRSSWRRWEATSGGLMLEKCCHDMDLLNWICEGRPVRVSSMGGSRIFTPSAVLPDECDKCHVADDCNYFDEPKISDHEDESEAMLHRYVEPGQCIYNIDKDIVDTQSVQLEFSSGVLVNFLLSLNCAGPRASRNFHAIGQRGRIWGNLHEAVVRHYDNATGQLHEYSARGDGSGHGGGDRIHALELCRMIEDREYQPDQDVRAGYLSAMLCFAADLSRRENRSVALRYHDSGRIELG